MRCLDLLFHGYFRLDAGNGSGKRRVAFIGPDEPLLTHIVGKSRLLAPDDAHRALTGVTLNGSNWITQSACHAAARMIERGKPWDELKGVLDVPGVVEALFPDE